jgi:hypothetical protein
MIFSRNRFEHRFEKAFGFPSPHNQTELAEIREQMSKTIREAARRAHTDLLLRESDRTDLKREKLEDRRTNYDGQGWRHIFRFDYWLLYVGVPLLGAYEYTESKARYDHLHCLALQVGLSLNYINQIERESRQEAAKLPFLQAA